MAKSGDVKSPLRFVSPAGRGCAFFWIDKDRHRQPPFRRSEDLTSKSLSHVSQNCNETASENRERKNGEFGRVSNGSSLARVEEIVGLEWQSLAIMGRNDPFAPSSYTPWGPDANCDTSGRRALRNTDRSIALPAGGGEDSFCARARK